MNLKTIFNDICEEIKDLDTIGKKFGEFQTDEERFALVYDACRDFIWKLNFISNEKCGGKSGRLRKNGNEHFAKNLNWEALKLYNESIALAPNNSEELALAYGNRAACLMRLDFPGEALSDIDKGLNLPVTDDFRKKLQLRKEKCLAMINDNKKSNYSFGNCQTPPLSRGESSLFDSASKLIELSYDEYWERQLITNDNVNCGEVLIVEKPYSSVLLPEHYYTHCTNCYRRSLCLIPCEKCCSAMFCSEKCLISSENRFHKIECTVLQILTMLNVKRMELLSLRLLIDASKQGEFLEKLQMKIAESEASNSKNIDTYKSLDFLNIYNLVTNTKKRKTSDLFYRSVICTILIIVLEKHTNFFNSNTEEKAESLKLFSGGLILRFMQSLPSNAHEVSEFCEDGLTEIGAGAYATLSLINHSCDPNVVRHSYGDMIVLRAIRPIKKGEQILDNYGYHYATHSLTERQNALVKQYYFKCQCEACVSLWPQYQDLPEDRLIAKKEFDVEVYKQLTQKFEKNLQSVLTGDFSFDVIPEFMTYLDFLDEYVQRPWKPYNKCQEALKHCISFLGNHFRLSKGVDTP